MARPPRNRPHFHVEGGGEAEAYTSPRTPRDGLPPVRARAAHAQKLQQSLTNAVAAALLHLEQRNPEIAVGEKGFYLEFDLDAGDRGFVDALENKPSKIELVAVRPQPDADGMISATVFVPEGSAEFYGSRVEAYRTQESPKSGRPKNERLVARIEDVRLAVARSLFTDDPATFPEAAQVVWWEVWIRDERLIQFRHVAQRLNIAVKDHTIRFPERVVVLVLGDVAALTSLLDNSDAIAELRLAKDTPTLFLDMPVAEQMDWVGDLAGRVTPAGEHAPAVCILDSGTMREHALIAPALSIDDMHTVVDGWGTGDTSYWNGHGTSMAGVALYGDLEAALSTGDHIILGHRLESVKVLAPIGENDPLLYGAITATGIGKAEALSPGRPRVFCMAVTSNVGLGRGRPSSWSAAVDQIA
jgi:hypothetical protein